MNSNDFLHWNWLIEIVFFLFPIVKLVLLMKVSNYELNVILELETIILWSKTIK